MHVNKKTAEWSIVLAVAVVLVAGGLTILFLVRYGGLDATPWEPLGIAAGGFGAVAGIMIAIGQAFDASIHSRYHGPMHH